MGALTTERPPASIRVPRSSAESLPQAISWRKKIGAYVALTKPRIISLLLFTTVPAMILADQGMP